jgi:flagellar basal body P-ring protein FlgI
VQVTGYGLVVGLDRTGDRARGLRGSAYTVQSVANMLQRFGITVDPQVLASRNVAAVMVTTTLDPFAGPGSPSTSPSHRSETPDRSREACFFRRRCSIRSATWSW